MRATYRSPCGTCGGSRRPDPPAIPARLQARRCSRRGPFALAGVAASIHQEQGYENRHPQDHAQDDDGSQWSEKLSGAQRRRDRGEGGGNHCSLTSWAAHLAWIVPAPSGVLARARHGLPAIFSVLVSAMGCTQPILPRSSAPGPGCLPVLIRPAERDRANPTMTEPISPTTAATMAPIRPGLMV